MPWSNGNNHIPRQTSAGYLRAVTHSECSEKLLSVKERKSKDTFQFSSAFSQAMELIFKSLSVSQFGIWNSSENVTGSQIALVANFAKKTIGSQASFGGNRTKNICGIQLSLFGHNTANNVTGIQLGLGNSTKELAGLQIGLLNSKFPFIGIGLGMKNLAKLSPAYSYIHEDLKTFVIIELNTIVPEWLW